MVLWCERSVKKKKKKKKKKLMMMMVVMRVWNGRFI